jgi:V/A-type H+-transporting ATPase subunit A
MTVLQREDRLQQIVRLVGPDVLPDSQRLILFIAEIFKDGFLTQSAYDEVDSYCSPERQVALLRLILMLYRRGRDLVHAGAPLVRLREMKCVPDVVRAKAAYGNDKLEGLKELESRVSAELDALEKEYIRQGS